MRTIDSGNVQPATIDAPPVLTDEAPPPKTATNLAQADAPPPPTPQDEALRAALPFAPAIAMANSPATAGPAVSASAAQSNQTVSITVKSSAATTPKSPPPDIAIGRVRIDGGEVDFSDLSLPLPFATRVHHVSGEITAIAPDNAAGSSLKIEGTVDEHGFAKATGFVNLFDPIAFTDIKVGFRNIELTSMTPYSGKFMGYRIKRGKLSLGLEYDIKQAQLKADNKILLERLYLGEKIESPDAVGLPIKLALALLRDKNGNIDLDLAVHGDLNDPKVNTAALIWQALKKVIIKITTAPFRFLGNLLGIGGGDDLEFVEFEGGDSRLTPPQHERLDNVARALTERPLLKLQVCGVYDKNIDTEAMRAHQFDALLMSRLLASANGDSAAVRAIVSDPSSGRMQTVLESLMTESFGAEAVTALRAERTTVPAVRRFVAHLDREWSALFSFLYDPTLDATNWRAEQALRPAVVNRKVSGGNRTWLGAQTQQVLTTLLRTSTQRHLDPLRILADLLRERVPRVAAALFPT